MRAKLSQSLSPESRTKVNEDIMFVPTGSMALMETIHDARPNHSIIAADFDYLPDVTIPGKNAPLVSEKVNLLDKSCEVISS
jgi:hypothetical protein